MVQVWAAVVSWFASLEQHTALWAGIWLSGALVLALLAFIITRRLLMPLLNRLVIRSRLKWADVMFGQGLFGRLSYLVPLVVLHWSITYVPNLGSGLRDFLMRLAAGLMILVAVRGFASLLAALHIIYCRSPISNSRPIKGYLQAISLVVHILGGLFILSGFLGQSPWYLLSGVGAMMAILLLIFRDTLLGLVAGVQLTSNDLVRVNDWIEMPQFDADGDVVDIALNTVKVRNWDNTVTVIPSHKFLEHSFKNWRSMHELGGRRIKRSLNLDMTSVRFLEMEEVEQLGRYSLLSDYIQAKMDDIAEYNQKNQAPAGFIPNERRLTNIGTFRAYIQAYLHNNPQIHKELTFLVRQLQPTAQGLPLEIYVFTNDTRWAVYEGIQADVFDHLLAMLPEFGLKIFQDPTGSDFANLNDSRRATSPARALAEKAGPAKRA